MIENKYPNLPDGKERSYDELHRISKDVWDDIKLGTLAKLVSSMPRRFLAVLDAGGGHEILILGNKM